MRSLLLAGVLLMSQSVPAADAPTAAEMMERAHRARAEWHDFAGLAAKVTLRVDGTSATGSVTVKDEEVRFDVAENPDQAWFDRRFESFCSHQISRGGEHDYDVSFADDDVDHPLGRLIKFNEDRLHSHYRINDDVITEVHRTMGETRFTITVLDVGRTKDGLVHSNLYTVDYWDTKSGALTRSEVYRNEWATVDGLPVPTRLLTVTSAGDGTRTVREIVLEDVKVARTAAE